MNYEQYEILSDYKNASIHLCRPRYVLQLQEYWKKSQNPLAITK